MRFQKCLTQLSKTYILLFVIENNFYISEFQITGLGFEGNFSKKFLSKGHFLTCSMRTIQK